MSDPLAVLAPQPLSIDGVELRVAPLGGMRLPDHLVVVKPMDAVEAYRRLLGGHDRPRVVELGIAYGGSVALIALLADPRLMVAVELSEERSVLLDELIADRDLPVRLHYGTDQADEVRLTEIIEQELAGEPLDLVIDDASHRYPETIASFEVLFPRLRPGGQFIIEDWSSDHRIRALLATALADPASPQHQWAQEAMGDRIPSANAGQPAQSEVAVAALDPARSGPTTIPPLSRLAARLVLGAAEPGSGIDSVEVDQFWVAVTRDDTELDPATFSVDEACPDHFGTLST